MTNKLEIEKYNEMERIALRKALVEACVEPSDEIVERELYNNSLKLFKGAHGMVACYEDIAVDVYSLDVYTGPYVDELFRE
ncbi:MAG: hypothetical protein LUH05_04015 [Candidatus Gastranaerophilales bacterium]|nr:hypothetical protein [Candidatus Gastranaerophilales bacterium]